MRTLAVVARKGGSGKTTVAVNLAVAAHMAGRATRLLDTDLQGSAVEVFSQRQGPGPDCRATVPVNLLRAQLDARAEGVDALIIDTPAGSEEAMSTALVLADLAILVVRPTFLDLAGALQTAAVLKRLRKPSLILLNQAPPARSGIEPPAVRKALEALQLIGLPVVPVILRARASYQTAMASGRSALEACAAGGAIELVQAWDHLERSRSFHSRVASPRRAGQRPMSPWARWQWRPMPGRSTPLI
jgi:chromosome partitioning protein